MYSGGVTGGAANADDAGGGAANVVGGGAESGCVAVGNCTRCACASSANIKSVAAAVNRTSGFNGLAVSGREKRPGSDQRAVRARGQVINIPRQSRQLQGPPGPIGIGGHAESAANTHRHSDR